MLTRQRNLSGALCDRHLAAMPDTTEGKAVMALPSRASIRTGVGSSCSLSPPESLSYWSSEAVTLLASAFAGVSMTNTTRRLSSAPGWLPQAPRFTRRVSP